MWSVEGVTKNIRPPSAAESNIKKFIYSQSELGVWFTRLQKYIINTPILNFVTYKNVRVFIMGGNHRITYDTVLS